MALGCPYVLTQCYYFPTLAGERHVCATLSISADCWCSTLQPHELFEWTLGSVKFRPSIQNFCSWLLEIEVAELKL